jgi:hypothetical protein
MMESKSYYFPNENPQPAKGWVVSAKVPNGVQNPGELNNPWNYQECGCSGFDSRKAASDWLDRAQVSGHVPQEAVVSIDFKK